MLTMDAGAKGWLVRTSKRHFWRICSWYEFDDLIQDGYLHYARLIKRYPDVTSRAHIMRLFQITFINHLNDISKKKTRQIDVAVSNILRDGADSTDFFERCGGTEDEFSIALAPHIVKAALAVYSDPKNAKALRSVHRVKLSGKRESTNERLCRLAGLDPSAFDLQTALKKYLTAAV